MKIRRLFWDVEILPNVVLSFRIGRDQNINHDALVKERSLICIGYKFEGDSRVTVLRASSSGCDRRLIKRFLDVAETADELVAHFGDRADLPWLKGRAIINGLDPAPLFKTVDTYKLAKRNFGFNSFKLDYLSNLFGHGGKMHSGFKLWKNIAVGGSAEKRRALNYICKYCGIDVIRLQSVFRTLEPWTKPSSHVGVMNGKENHSCPHCGGDHSEYFRKRVSASGVVQHQRRCLTCKSYFVISDSANKKYNKQRNGKG